MVVSLVAEDQRLLVGGMARLDIPADDEAQAATLALLTMGRQQSAAGVLLIGYEDITGKASHALRTLAGASTVAGMRLLDVFTVNGDRYRSLGCTETTCCPPDGKAVPVTDLTAESVAAGSAPYNDRGDLERRYAAEEKATEIGRLCDDLAAEAPVAAGDGLTCWAQLLRDPDHGDPEIIATAAAALRVTEPLHVRDALLLWLCPGLADVTDERAARLVDVVRAHLADALPWGGPDGTRADRAAAASVAGVLARVCASLPDRHASQALAVAGYFAWWHGDGATTVVTLERIRATEPLTGLADLLDRLVTAAVRPPGLQPR